MLIQTPIRNATEQSITQAKIDTHFILQRLASSHRALLSVVKNAQNIVLAITFTCQLLFAS